MTNAEHVRQRRDRLPTCIAPTRLTNAAGVGRPLPMAWMMPYWTTACVKPTRGVRSRGETSGNPVDRRADIGTGAGWASEDGRRTSLLCVFVQPPDCFGFQCVRQAEMAPSRGWAMGTKWDRNVPSWHRQQHRFGCAGPPVPPSFGVAWQSAWKWRR